MSEMWEYPVDQPLFTHLYAQEIVAEAKMAGKKPHAFDTRLRFSDAGRCSRAIAYGVLGAEPEDWDPASLHVAAQGTFYHERLQGAIKRAFPQAEVEVKARLDECTDSGHADAVVRGLPTGAILYELKTKSSYQFDKAVGVMRKSWWKSTQPEGPGLEVILQAGLNALANDCETVVIGYVTFENFSVQLAEKLGLRQMDRFLAEWHIPKDVWEPLVWAEIERLNHVLESVDNGMLPEREVYGDDREPTIIAPEDAEPAWNCSYCSFRSQCEADGPGVVPVPLELREAS